MLQITCWNCGKQFTPKRSSAKYCSTNCRVAYNRLTTRAEKIMSDVLYAVDDLERTIEQHPELAPEIDDLQRAIQMYAKNTRQARVWACACGNITKMFVRPTICLKCGKPGRFSLQPKLL